jgi:hypothetical protein
MEKIINFIKNPLRSPKIAMSLIDKDITRHLQYRGKIDDDWGQILVDRLIREALKVHETKSMLTRHNFTDSHLKSIFTLAVTLFEGQPCIKLMSSSMLVASLIFVEPYRLDELLSSIRSSITYGEYSFEDAASTSCMIMSKTIKNDHDAHYGSFEMEILGNDGDPIKHLAYK